MQGVYRSATPLTASDASIEAMPITRRSQDWDALDSLIHEHRRDADHGGAAVEQLHVLRQRPRGGRRQEGTRFFVVVKLTLIEPQGAHMVSINQPPSPFKAERPIIQPDGLRP